MSYILYKEFIFFLVSRLVRWEDQSGQEQTKSVDESDLGSRRWKIRNFVRNLLISSSSSSFAEETAIYKVPIS